MGVLQRHWGKGVMRSLEGEEMGLRTYYGTTQKRKVGRVRIGTKPRRDGVLGTKGTLALPGWLIRCT